MSRPSQTTRPSFASQTGFAALPVDSGEESDSEITSEPTADPAPTKSEGPPKLSKTAQRKAAKAARLEKKQQKVAAKATRVNGDSTPDSPAAKIALPALGTEANPVEVDSDADIELIPRANQEEIPYGSSTLASSDQTKPQRPLAAPGPTSFVPPSVPSSNADDLVPAKVENGEALPRTNGVAHPPNGDAAEEPTETESEAKPVDDSKRSDDAERTKKRQSFFVRTLWTFIMIGGFIGLLLLGHAYMILLVMLCQTVVYREVTALFALAGPKSEETDDETEGRDPWSKTLNWYFFAVTNYFLYGESIIYYFKHVVFADANLLPFATNHRFISFVLYTIGFVGFVSSLQRGHLKKQFGLFCWVHMTLLIIVVSSHFIVNNILEGLIWFWVPASLVICNDVFAYICGITMGRTPLIKLSPKKTVEGFVGAFFCTLIFSVIWGTYFMRFDYMVCPVRDLGVSAWSSVKCARNPVFLWKEWEIPAPLRLVLSTTLGRVVSTVPYVPYQFHLLVMACFASLVAPFGGFFASGFKRAFNIKDFGHSIPGHGGMTDRMDCQFLMGVFTYVYYSSIIREHHVTVGSALQMIVSGLTIDEQLELIADLKRYLEGRGLEIPIPAATISAPIEAVEL